MNQIQENEMKLPSSIAFECRGSRGGRLAATISVLLILLSAFVAKAGDYVLVVDTSGSMNEKVSTKDNRIRMAVVQKALREYLPALPFPARVHLVAFNTGIVSEKEVILRDEKTLNEALAWVNDLEKTAKRNGQTHLWTTLYRALEIASAYSQENASQPVVVRVLTDGEDNERVTSFEKVLREFPLVDGEHIRGNLVLLGDLELKTKLALPEGAFETSRNTHWSDLFPPVVLLFPDQPRIGDEVRFVENTRSIYAAYEWLIDNKPVGNEKVLTWRFAEPRTYRVTLKVKGLDGTANSSALLVRVKEQQAFTVAVFNPQKTAQPGEQVHFFARPSSAAIQFRWFVNSMLVGTNQDLMWRSEQEGNVEIKVLARNESGREASDTQIISVKEVPLAAKIKGPTHAVAGESVQFAGETSGRVGQMQWRFGDGSVSTDKNPTHTFVVASDQMKVFQVFLRLSSPSGGTIETGPHSIQVKGPASIKPARAAFRIVEQNARVGDQLHLIDESSGHIESWHWEITGEGDSTERSPIVLLTTPGTKTVKLIVNGPAGPHESSKQIMVLTRYAPASLKIAASKISGKVPLSVQFTNLSTGDIKSVRWDFGDGHSSTNSSPRHEYTVSSNYTVNAIAFPTDASQSPVRASIVVRASMPMPMWIKALLLGIPLLALAGIGIYSFKRRQREKLRLTVYYWPDDSSVCRRIDLTRSNERCELKPLLPLRLIRTAKSSNLLAEPTDGAVLVASDGQELRSQNIGQGVRLVLRTGAGLARAVAIAVNQKPHRPSPAIEEANGLADRTPSSPTPATDFDWNLETTALEKRN